MSAFRLVQVADIHLGAGQEYHLDNWHKVLAWMERERPDQVVANGDLILGDPDDEGDYAFARDAFARLGKLGVPCRFLPGNHDVGDNIVSGNMDKRVNTERCARFVSYFGEERWAFEAAGWGFAGINAQWLGSNGHSAEAAQWQWLQQTLAGFSGKHIALFLHKPLFLDHPSEQDHEVPSVRQSVIDAASRARLLALCKEYGVRLVSSGHKHQTRSFALDGIYHIWAPSTACVNGAPTSLHWGTREVGFVDFQFHPDGFEHRIVGTDFLFRHESYVRKWVAAG